MSFFEQFYRNQMILDFHESRHFSRQISLIYHKFIVKLSERFRRGFSYCSIVRESHSCDAGLSLTSANDRFDAAIWCNPVKVRVVSVVGCSSPLRTHAQKRLSVFRCLWCRNWWKLQMELNVFKSDGDAIVILFTPVKRNENLQRYAVMFWEISTVSLA